MHFVFALVLILAPAFAHQTSLTASGSHLYWPNPNIPLSIQTNTTDLSATQVQSIVQNSMTEWNNSSVRAKIISSPSSTNRLSFVSNFPYGSAVLGVSELSYNTSGAIQQANVLLNDDFFFHATEGFHPGYQIFLGDVVTHELGHMLGLGHSEVLNATMFYQSFPGQSTVAPDDKGGVRLKYDSSFGSIYGYVKGGNQIGILGAHVQAISRVTGESVSAISDEDGYFVIGGLDLNDTYYLNVSPVKNVESLPGYFANVQKNFCPGNYVSSFFSACGRENDGKPQGINITSLSPHVDVGTISIHCSLKTDPDYDDVKLQSSSLAIEIFNYQIEQKYEKAFVGWFRKTSSTAWSGADLLTVDLRGFTALSGTTKYVKFSIVSFPFGTQLEYEIQINKNGAPIGSAVRPLIYSNLTETYSTDYSAYQPLDPVAGNNIYELSIRSKKLSTTVVSQTFPAPDIFSTDQYLPYMVIASIYELTPSGWKPLLDTQSNLSDNAACLDAPFAYSISKADADTGQGTTASSDQVAAAAGCGTIEPPSDGPGSSMPLLAVGFFLVMLASTLVKSRKNFLS